MNRQELKQLARDAIEAIEPTKDTGIVTYVSPDYVLFLARAVLKQQEIIELLCSDLEQALLAATDDTDGSSSISRLAAVVSWNRQAIDRVAKLEGEL